MKNKRIVNYNLTDYQLHYLAGVIDAGSTFYLTKQACGRKDKETGKYQLRWVNGFSIQHTNHKLIEYFTQLLFLGDSCIHILDAKSSGHNHRLVKIIKVTGQILDYIIPELIPILKIKKEHAQIILDFRKTINHEKYQSIPLHVEEYRKELSIKMSYLNSKLYKNLTSSPLIPSKPKCC